MRLWQRGKRGIWWVDFTVAGQRVTRSAGTTSRSQAEEWAARLASDLWRTRRLGDKPRLTWGTAVLDWLRKHGDERRSIETMKDRLRWISAHLENVQLADITPQRLDAILSAYEGANGTRNRFVAEVSKILHHAHREGWIAAVPAFRRYHEPRAEPRWLTQEQADMLIDELPAHLADMARFSLATGLRESNVRLLRWSQVDIVRAVAWVLGSETKNKRALSVPLNADALEVLHRRRHDHKVYVFVYEGHPVWNCSSHAWYKAVKRAKLTGLRWHDLRHTWASWHVMAGTPLPVLQQLGGWSSYSMVLRYAHVAVDYTARYADGSLRSKSVTTAEGQQREAPQVLEKMGWPMGLEPTTTGITRPSSTSNLLNLNDALARKRRKTA
jgi:integrase